MKLRSILITGAAALMIALPSCKDKEEEVESFPYLSGSLVFDFPSYVLPNETFHLIPKGASNPTTGNVGYYWYSSWLSAKDTTKRETAVGDGSWTVTTPVALGLYTITAGAYATDYTSLATTKSFYVIDPAVDATITGAGYQTDSATFKDSRDNATYYLATNAGKVWMQNNLYYSGSGISFDNSPAIDPVFGRLYNWDEAVTACPDGWHLPSDLEFAQLAGAMLEGSTFETGKTFEGVSGAIMTDAYFLGSKMWTFWPDVKITNKSKLSALPIGYALDQGTSHRYKGMNNYAAFWTSDQDGEMGIYRYIYVDKPDVFVAKGDKKSFRASVRCVKDAE